MTTSAPERKSIPTLTWCVVPSPYEAAFGVPVFGYVDVAGSFHTTSISPAADCDGTHYAGGLKRTDLTAVVDHELGNASQAVKDTVHAALTFLAITPEVASHGVHADLVAGFLHEEDLDTPAVRVATRRGEAAVLTFDVHQGAVRLKTAWVTESLFAPDPDGFARHTFAITEQELAAGLAPRRADLATAGLEALARDDGRVVPDLVMAAMALAILEGAPRKHPARRRANQLLNLIYARAGIEDEDGLPYYVSGISAIRSALKVLTSMRKEGKEEMYDQAAATPAWSRLIDSIVDSLQVTARCEGIAGADDPGEIRRHLEALAEQASDRYTAAMCSAAGRLASGLAESAASPCDAPVAENPLAAHIRRLLHLLGPFPWQQSRPYDFGVLCAVIGNW